MQKKLIALAIASTVGGLVSVPVFAQSQVQVYGIIDEAVTVANYGAGNVTQLKGSAYNTERLGFQGSEDMGNGLKANFRLELGQVTDTGSLDNSNNQLFQREATLGLSGPWGQIRAGRTYSPLFIDIQAANDMFYVAGYGSNYALTSTGMTRVNNQLKYDSASMNGFQIGVGYGMGDTTSAATYVLNPNINGIGQESSLAPKDLGRHVGVSLRYTNGPLFVGYGYGGQKATTAGAGLNPIETKAQMVTGNYDFKVVKVFAGYQTVNNDANPRTVDQRVWNVGGSVPLFGNDHVKLQYTKLEVKLPGVTNADSHLIALGYEHPMSKRTTLFGTYAKMDNDAAVARSFLNGNALITSAGAANPGYSPNSFQVGLSHKF